MKKNIENNFSHFGGRMRMNLISIFIMLGLIMINCKSMPSQGPAAKDSAVLGVKVKFNGMISDTPAARD